MASLELKPATTVVTHGVYITLLKHLKSLTPSKQNSRTPKYVSNPQNQTKTIRSSMASLELKPATTVVTHGVYITLLKHLKSLTPSKQNSRTPKYVSNPQNQTKTIRSSMASLELKPATTVVTHRVYITLLKHLKSLTSSK
jgi:hypothetical protein